MPATLTGWLLSIDANQPSGKLHQTVQKNARRVSRGRHPAKRDLLQRLQSAAGEWQSTFDAIPDMVLILDGEMRIVRANAAAVNFFGRPPEQIIGSLCHGLIHGSTCPVGGCPVQKTLLTQRREEAGVRIYEFKPTMLHNKVMLVDDLWSSIGSINFTGRSMKSNAEANVAVYDRDFAAKLRASIEADMARSEAITPGHWKERGTCARLKECYYGLYSNLF